MLDELKNQLVGRFLDNRPRTEEQLIALSFGQPHPEQVESGSESPR
jgi:hypothetical protein